MFEMTRAFTVYCETVGGSTILYELVVIIIVSHFNPSSNLPFLTAKNATGSNRITILNSGV